jgi:hypothetical protein
VAILPSLDTDSNSPGDPIEALITLRNGLSHGSSDVHSPAMALDVVATCASWIDHVYPQP